MRNLRLPFLALTLLVSLSATSAAQEKSLYDRLGGKPAITAVVDEFAARSLADARINKKFAKSDPARLKFELVEQICAASGGPCKYTGRDMKVAHTNMGVTEGEFNALVEDLVGALDKLKVPEKEKNELLALLGPMKPQIVEVNSADTGTALPTTFKPAPPLKKKDMKEAKKEKSEDKGGKKEKSEKSEKSDKSDKKDKKNN
ncbi:MAG TPA: group 1 truncated hemoglobin [Blastocatellia bacterium]|nr:group 1 truncated hemoglobin [Blastocatellia bacterium]